MERSYPVLGHSMRFLLEPGDCVSARPCAAGEPRAGDIALLVKWERGLPSGYVLHRVLLNLPLPGRRLLLTKGDANLLPDWPPDAYQPAGLAVALQRGGSSYPLSRGPASSLLLPLYSLAANKALYLAAAFAASFFSLLCRLRPALFSAQLNALYLAWESSLYPALLSLLAAPARPRGGKAGAPAAAVKSGRIRSDETWSGRVAVADYLMIEKGASVTVLPGTEIVFERREPWFFPVLRAAGGGKVRELESAGAKLLVYGSFRAAGTAEAPVVFGGPAFAGLHALGGGSLKLEHCLLSGSSACALSAWDGAELMADHCRAAESARGAEVYGSARAVFRDCSFSGTAGAALLAGGHAALLVYGGEASGCGGAAAELGGDAVSGFYGFRASGCAGGLYLSARAGARLERCAVSGNSGPAVRCSDKASFSAAGSSFTENPSGLDAEGSTVLSLVACALAATNGPSALFSGANSVSFSACSFSGGKGPTVQARGHNALSFADCSFSGGEACVDLSGRGRLELLRCSFSATQGAALRLLRPASARAAECRFTACKAGLRAEDAAALDVINCVFEDNEGPAAYITGAGALTVSGSALRANAAGLHLAGALRARISGTTLHAQRGAPLLLSERVACELSNCAFSANGSGAALSGRASAEAYGCSFTGNAGPAFELSGETSLSAENTSFAGGPAALLLEGKSAAELRRCSAESSARPAACLSGESALCAAGSSFKAASDAVYARGGASVDLGGCALFAGSGAALNLSGGSARLRRVYASGAGGLLVSGGASVVARALEISAADYAVEARSAETDLRDLRSRGGQRGGLQFHGGAASLRGASLSGAPYPGLAASGGARLSCRGVLFDGRPWVPPAATRAAPWLRPALARFAAATAGLPGFAALYRLLYLAAANAAGAVLKPRAGGSLYLYRGMAAPGWVPGLSDMDLALLLPELPPAEDWRAFSALRRRLRAFRALFPFTGEVLAAPAADFSAFISGWGLKGAEFTAASRLLAGAPLPSAAPSEGRAADQTEAFYAYTLLLGHFYGAGLPPAFRTRNCRKGLADVLRYLDFASPHRASRSDYAEARGLRLQGPGADPGEAAFLAFQALHRAFPAAAGGEPARAGGAGVFNRYAFGQACEALRAEAGGVAGVVLDSLYRVYMVLPDAAADDKAVFLRAAKALRSGGAAGYFSAAPLILTRSSFAALSGLPYLNNPLFRLDLASQPDGRSPEDGGVYAWQAEVPKAHGAAEVRAGAAIAARHFSASWRSLWGAMPPHYFYTRAAGLRLLLAKGACPPFSRPHELSESFCAAFGPGPGWGEFSAGGAGRANYEFVAVQCRALREAAGGN